jgi:YfiH family protein
VADGDFGVARSEVELEPIRSAVLARPWSWLHQVHGSSTVLVAGPGDQAGTMADAAVTAAPGAPLAIHTADCAPVALVSPEGVVGAVHGGWRGLEAGVVQAAVESMRSLGARSVQAVVGPCIRPECYEFGSGELDRLARQFGPGVRAETSWGSLALDLPAAVRAALHGNGLDGRGGGRGDGSRVAVDGLEVLPICTSCDRRFYSHRARQDAGRQAMLVWIEGTPREEAGRV